MRPHVFFKRAFVCSSVVVLASSLSPFATQAEEKSSNQAEDQQLKGAIILPPKERFGDVAPGAVEDTLKGCLARIPDDASIGQRLLAERTCQREEEIRQTYQGARRF